jgi:hypothetical protein
MIFLCFRENLDNIPTSAEELSFGNSVYKITFDNRERPVFGHKYWFFLQDAVENVPEYVVRWDNFVQYVFDPPPLVFFAFLFYHWTLFFFFFVPYRLCWPVYFCSTDNRMAQHPFAPDASLPLTLYELI